MVLAPIPQRIAARHVGETSVEAGHGARTRMMLDQLTAQIVQIQVARFLLTQAASSTIHCHHWIDCGRSERRRQIRIKLWQLRIRLLLLLLYQWLIRINTVIIIIIIIVIRIHFAIVIIKTSLFGGEGFYVVARMTEMSALLGKVDWLEFLLLVVRVGDLGVIIVKGGRLNVSSRFVLVLLRRESNG